MTVAMLVSACSRPGPTGERANEQTTVTTPDTLSAAGTIRVRATPPDERVEGGPCIAAPGYDDIAEGADVTVTDDRGATVGTSQLRSGTLKFIDNGNVWCSFTFIVRGIPAGKKFYALTAGQRDPEQLTEADLHSSINLQIGN